MANSLGIALPSGDCMTTVQLQGVIDQLVTAIVNNASTTTVNASGALLANGTNSATAPLIGVTGGIGNTNLAVWGDIYTQINGIARHVDDASEIEVMFSTASVAFDGAGNATLLFANATHPVAAFNDPSPIVVAVSNASIAIGTTSTNNTSVTFTCPGAASTTRAVAFIAMGYR